MNFLELLIVIGVIGILAVLAVPALHNFQLTSDLENSSEELVNVLRSAQQKTVASEGASSWGVYFSTSTLPHQYTLFRGESYSSRDMGVDEIHKISGTVLISEISLGGGFEVVFNKVFGTSRQRGSVSLALKANPSENKTVYIGESGTFSDINRIKDSRHVHTDYNRHISTTTENITLTFSYGTSTQTEIIVIADNMKEGQIYWEGQELKIHTHRLNQLDTQFSIHRDGRYNTRALKVELSGDSTGSLINYSADGLITNKTSIYASEPQWQ